MTTYETSWAHHPDVLGEDGNPRSDHDTFPNLVGYPDTLVQALDEAGQEERCTNSGLVKVAVLVDEAGRVAETQLAQGIGGECDEVALEAVKLVEYEPAKDGDEPQKSVLVLPINFR